VAPESGSSTGSGTDAAGGDGGRGPAAGDILGNTPVSLIAVLGGVEHRNSSQDFRGGHASAILGGCDIDLRRASIASGPAILDVFAFWAASRSRCLRTGP